MPNRIRYAFWIDESQRDALRAIKARDGILESEQIRRGIEMWIKAKGGAVGRGKRSKRPRGRQR
jgi:hypothetical protein